MSGPRAAINQSCLWIHRSPLSEGMERWESKDWLMVGPSGTPFFFRSGATGPKREEDGNACRSSDRNDFSSSRLVYYSRPKPTRDEEDHQVVVPVTLPAHSFAILRTKGTTASTSPERRHDSTIRSVIPEPSAERRLQMVEKT